MKSRNLVWNHHNPFFKNYVTFVTTYFLEFYILPYWSKVLTSLVLTNLVSMLGRPYQFNSTKIRQGMTLHASFFINNVFFQLTSVLLNFSINLASNIAKVVCLIHVDILLWHFLDLVCLCLCVRQGLFVSYRCDLFFINIPLKFFKGCLPQILLGSLMNTLSHIFSLKQRRLLFWPQGAALFLLNFLAISSWCCL